MENGSAVYLFRVLAVLLILLGVIGYWLKVTDTFTSVVLFLAGLSLVFLTPLK